MGSHDGTLPAMNKNTKPYGFASAARTFPLALSALLALVLMLGGCGVKEEPPSRPEPVSKTRYLGWYDIGPSSNLFCCIDKAARSSNLMYMRVRGNEFSDLIHKAKEGNWPAVILGGDEEDHFRTATAAKAIVDSGLNLIGIIYQDEPDLAAPVIRNRNLTQHLTHHYNALKVELNKLGLGRIPIAANWSLASPPPWTWKKKLDQFGVPPMDMYVTDSWYSARDNELHLVRHRTVEWLDYMFAKSGPKPIIHVLKAWSRVPPDIQKITPEWVLRQLRCVTGTGASRFSWTHPRTGDVADVKVQPLPPKYRPLAVLLYKMDPTRNQDTDQAGGNRPDIVDAVAKFAKPRGWTVR